jgi:hypothetical protein
MRAKRQPNCSVTNLNPQFLERCQSDSKQLDLYAVRTFNDTSWESNLAAILSPMGVDNLVEMCWRNGLETALKDKLLRLPIL